MWIQKYFYTWQDAPTLQRKRTHPEISMSCEYKSYSMSRNTLSEHELELDQSQSNNGQTWSSGKHGTRRRRNRRFLLTMCFMIFPSLCTTSLCSSVSINEKTIAAVSSLPIQALPQSSWSFLEIWCSLDCWKLMRPSWASSSPDKVTEENERDLRAGKNWVPAQRSRYKAEEGHGWKPAPAGHARYHHFRKIRNLSGSWFKGYLWTNQL